ncbi:MAG: hypothetical protein U0795_20360 [Pirellulales bacterium]
MTVSEHRSFLIRETVEVRYAEACVTLFSQAERSMLIETEGGLGGADCDDCQQRAGQTFTNLLIREFREESFQVRRVADGSAPHTDGRAS